MSESISLSGITTHNLQNIDVDIPLYSLTAVSGISGSGKSSLVFHTLHAQSYHRYIGSLSSYTRQFLKSFPKPTIKDTYNLPPSIAVAQKRAPGGRQSTVGSLSEIDHLLEIIFSQLTTIECPHHHGPISVLSREGIARKLVSEYADRTITITSPLQVLVEQLSSSTSHTAKAQRTVLDKALLMLQEQGFVRLLCTQDQSLHRLKNLSAEEILKHAGVEHWDIIMDRLQPDTEELPRLQDAIHKALTLCPPQLHVYDQEGTLKYYGLTPVCSECGFEALPPSPQLFHATHPLGACPSCMGYGYAMIWNWDKILNMRNLKEPSLNTGILPLYKVKGGEAYYEKLRTFGSKKVDLDKPLHRYTDAERDWIRFGTWSPDACVPADSADTTSAKTKKTSQSGFGGILEFLAHLQKQKSTQLTRMHVARFRTYELCKACDGHRLGPHYKHYHFKNVLYPELQQMGLQDLLNWLETEILPLAKDHPACEDAAIEAQTRLRYLIQIGLSYLSLHRKANSISGGELQRISLARCLGSSLTGTLYCLDEPTTGLHPTDSKRLIGVMQQLRDQGNTVVVVEHDPATLKACDHLLHIGPMAGHRGGQVCYAGPPNQHQSLMHSEPLPASSQRYPFTFASLKGAKTHNLQDATLSFPLRAITAVCGVSGSGKTSLIRHTLYPALCSVLNVHQKHHTSPPLYDSLGPAADLQKLTNVSLISQEALSRSSRSTIASYLNITPHIRKLFAATSEAQKLQMLATTFSFNTPGGRCETCRGLGTVEEDLSFLGSLTATCPTCRGKRFKPEVLQVHYQGKNIHEVFNFTVEEAYEFFSSSDPIQRTLKEVMDLGLGYITLGQGTHSFSGGEAQRLKILRILNDSFSPSKSTGAQCLIFDEPTGGLSETDVRFLYKKLQRLKEAGHTVIIIEHHVGLLNSVDWLVEVGPDAAAQGGQVLFAGPPQKLHQHPSSRIAKFLSA